MRKLHLSLGAALILIMVGLVYLTSPIATGGSEGENSAGTVDTAAEISYDPNTCDSACVIEQATTIASQQSPRAALTWLDSLNDDRILYECHATHHAVGVAAGKETYPEFPQYETSGCQYGYLHGTLQGVATETSYDTTGFFGTDPSQKMRSWLKRGSEFCETIDKSEKASPSKVRGATSECLHALGHGAAVIEHSDLRSVLEACSEFMEIAFACADGAIMEYADDTWSRAGWVHWETGYTDVETSFDPAQINGLCLPFTGDVAKACWRRIGNFAGPIFDGDPEKIGAICQAADDAEDQTECLFSAAAVAVTNAYRKNHVNWPPSDDAEAQTWMRTAVEECQRWVEFDTCLQGFVAPSTSHLHTAGLGHLVAKACDLELGDILKSCQKALARGENDK